jgi:hypothetical protein
VQQVSGENQCLDGVMNMYRDMCWDIIESLDSFCIGYIPREENREANALAQQASGYEVTRGLFEVKRVPATQGSFAQRGELAGQCCVKRQEEEHDRPTLVNREAELVGEEETGSQNNQGKLALSEGDTSNDQHGKGQVTPSRTPDEGGHGGVEWRQRIIKYLQDPNRTHDRKIRRQALKYIMCSGELYHVPWRGYY